MSRIMTDITPLAQVRKRMVSAEQVRNANTCDDICDGVEDLRLEIADEIRSCARYDSERREALSECSLALRQAADAIYKARSAYRHALQAFIAEGDQVAVK